MRKYDHQMMAYWFFPDTNDSEFIVYQGDGDTVGAHLPTIPPFDITSVELRKLPLLC